MSSISGVSGSAIPYTPSSTTGGIKQDLKNLGSSLQSGNVAAAQSALSSLTQNLQSSAGTTSSTSSSSGSSNIQSDLQSISTSLQSGNVSSAKQAFSKLQTDLQSALKAKHGGHHHAGKLPVAPSAQDADGDNDGSTTSTDQTSSSTTTGSLPAALSTTGANSVNRLA